MVDKLAFFCTSCKKRFRRGYAPRLCPWCGKETVAEDTTSGAADEMLKEIEEMEAQFK